MMSGTDQPTKRIDESAERHRAEQRKSAELEMSEIPLKENADSKDKTGPTEVVGFISLFRFATSLDVVYMIIGSIAAILHGVQFPLILLIFGNLIDLFTDRTFDLCTLNYSLLNSFCPPGIELNSNTFLTEYRKCDFSPLNFTLPGTDFMDNIRQQSLLLVGMGCAAIVIGYFQVAFWSIACERQTRRLRERLFRSILAKEIAYFDVNKTGQLSTKLTENVSKVHDGIGDKVGSALQFVAGFLAGLILGFVRGWKLTLVIMSVSPVLFVCALATTKIIASMTSKELKAYAKAGAIAEEVFSSIRTVLAYNGSSYESKRYEVQLRSAKLSGIRKGATNGILLGTVWFLVFCTYALGFWYGAKLVREEEFSVGRILTVFFAIITAVFSLGQAAPQLQLLAQARGAAYALWEIIDSPSKISIEDPNGIEKKDFLGHVQFSNVQFVYPTRPDVPVLKGLSFTAQPGQTTALVGSSGCGKSTCIQLLQRFYDPTGGSVEIDGVPVNQYRLACLREHIGVVSQEPLLFQTSIEENIKLGRLDATHEEIQQAAKMANAHHFIMELPEKYQTMVGERGAQLSGGQKQRIAIARALVRDPRILLLDEATSALDTESERVVQEALDRASKGRTTIVIAHRLSTIQNAAKIIVMENGSIIEEGNHEQLMGSNGVYRGLVETQNVRMKTNESDPLESMDDLEEMQVIPFHDRSSSSNGHSQAAKGQSPNPKDDVNEMMTSLLDPKDPLVTQYTGPSPFLSMLKLNRPELHLIVLGCLSCICNGGIQPAFGVILSKVIAVFQQCDAKRQEREILFYIFIFIALGFLMLFTMFLQSVLFAISGESLTQRLRAKIFRLLLRQEVAYFDQAENNTGALCTRLATEASDVQGASGIRIGTMLQNVANLGVGLILAFIYSWSLTLVVLGFIPFIVVGGFLQTFLLTGFANRDKSALENAGKISVEVISSIRTVAQLTKEKHFADEYCQLLDVPYRNSLKRAHVYGILFSTTDAVMFFAQAALFAFGAWRVEKGAMTFENVMLVFNCILFGAMAVGQSASMAPDYSKAIASSKKILDLFQRQPRIDNGSTEGKTLDNFQGHIDLSNLQFRYPNRAEVQVLNNYSLSVKPNQQVALVGSSGCGKSTTVQLLERFYEPSEGEILIDQNNLSALNLQWWRSQLGFVSQEPVLFDASIRENIAYGDTSRTVSMDEIYQAVSNANIHRFIESLPDKYETNVGSKGTQLSGGEKQRIAIARALIRNPKVLLLDEATSALDSESERVVQEALDQASKGRTSIVIAHRLSTIQNSDLICVLHRGRVVESGKHDELMARQRFYYRLAKAKH